MNAMLALAIVEKLIIYGPRALIEIQAAFDKGEPTAEEIRALKIEKDPEDYFNG